MNELQKLLKQMKDLIGQMDEIEGKTAEAEGEELEALTKDLESKVGEYQALESKAQKVKHKMERDAHLREMEKDANELISKAGELDDVDVPESEHNAAKWQQQRDRAAMDYLIRGKDALQDLARDNGQLVEAINAKTVDPSSDGGVVAPSYMRDHILTPRFVGKAGTNAVVTSDASGTNSGGASLVPDTFIPELYKIPQITDRLMDRCWVKRAIGGNAQFPKLTQSSSAPFGVQTYWGTEGEAMTQSNPEFTQAEVSTHRLTGLAYVSKKELRVNGVSLEAEMATMMRGAMDREISKAILAGNGSTAPRGINTNYSIGQGVAVVPRTTAGQVAWADLNKVMYNVDEGVMDEAIFVIRGGASGAMYYIAGLVDDYGRPLFRQATDGLGQVLLGADYVRTLANEAELGERGDVLFGAFRNYGLAVDQEVTIERSDEYAFNKGLVTFRVMGYFGGLPLGYSCFSLLGDVSTASSSSSSSSS